MTGNFTAERWSSHTLSIEASCLPVPDFLKLPFGQQAVSCLFIPSEARFHSCCFLVWVSLPESQSHPNRLKESQTLRSFTWPVFLHFVTWYVGSKGLSWSLACRLVVTFVEKMIPVLLNCHSAVLGSQLVAYMPSSLDPQGACTRIPALVTACSVSSLENFRSSV